MSVTQPPLTRRRRKSALHGAVPPALVSEKVRKPHGAATRHHRHATADALGRHATTATPSPQLAP